MCSIYVLKVIFSSEMTVFFVCLIFTYQVWLEIWSFKKKDIIYGVILEHSPGEEQLENYIKVILREYVKLFSMPSDDCLK